MQYTSLSFVAAAIGLLSVQMVPAPAAVTTAASTGTQVLGPMTNSNPTKRDGDQLSQILGSAKLVTGSISSGQARKRAAPAISSAIDCQKQLPGAKLRFSQPVHTTIHVEGVPPACMTVLSTISGKILNSNPIALGKDIIEFENLSDADLKQVEDLLNIHAK